MKLRIQGNSIRFRLLQGEVAQLQKGNKLQQTVEFPSGQKLIYALEVSASAKVSASFENQRILVKIPAASLTQWAQTSQVSIESTQPLETGVLEVLIEKDFKCLDATRPENADAFPNPREGLGCE